MIHFKVVMLVALIANTLALHVYDRTSYGRSAPAGVIYAQDLGYARTPSQGYSRALNVGYSHAASANLGYTHASRFGYGQGSEHYVHDPIDNYEQPNYEFNYDVNDAQTNDIKEQAERRVGDRVEGHYSVVEPDGTTRTVQYTADDRKGFNAVVTRHGDARHPVLPIRTHGTTAHSHEAPHVSYMQDYKYPSSNPERVISGISSAFAPDFSPNYAGSHRDAFSTPSIAYNKAPGHGYEGSFMVHHHSKKRLRHGYGGYY